MKFRLFLSTAALAVLAASTVPALAQAADPALPAAVPAKPTFGTWGVDLSARDESVKPGDDFQRHASGKWLDKTTIPDDRPSTGTFYDLRETVQDQVQSLIKDAPAGSKHGALYASFMDEARLETLGLKPLLADIAKIRAIKDKTAFARHMGGTSGVFGSALVGTFVGADTANPDINVLYIGQAGLGLPERDYYFNPQFAKQRDAYKAYIERTLQAIGTPKPKAAAATVYAFEEAIALSGQSAPCLTHT